MNNDVSVDDVFAGIRERFVLIARLETRLDDHVEDLRAANRALAFRFSKLKSLLPSQLPALVSAPELNDALENVRRALAALYNLTLVGLDHNLEEEEKNMINVTTTLGAADNQITQPEHQQSPSKLVKAIYFFNRYHSVWEAEVQESLHFVLLQHWLAAYTQGKSDLLITPESAAEVLGLHYSTKIGASEEKEIRDATLLHITIKEYLFAVLSLSSELASLAYTSVMSISLAAQHQHQPHNKHNPAATVEDMKSIPIAVKAFLQNIQAAFLTINFKNDALRRRYDNLKYDVKNVESIVYDLCVKVPTNRKY